jgi:hypothetical protein
VKLVFIYGPPAVGKLTVATELGRITSLAVFDNHLSIDCVLPVFGYGSESLERLSTEIQLLVIEEAARENVDIIFTFVYGHPIDVPFVERMCAAVETHGGTMCFVQLICNNEAQEQRVQEEDRARRKKTRSIDIVRHMNQRYDLSSTISGRSSLSIENTMMAADEAARQIAEHYSLTVVA